MQKRRQQDCPAWPRQECEFDYLLIVPGTIVMVDLSVSVVVGVIVFCSVCVGEIVVLIEGVSVLVGEIVGLIVGSNVCDGEMLIVDLSASELNYGVATDLSSTVPDSMLPSIVVSEFFESRLTVESSDLVIVESSVFIVVVESMLRVAVDCRASVFDRLTLVEVEEPDFAAGCFFGCILACTGILLMSWSVIAFGISLIWMGFITLPLVPPTKPTWRSPRLILPRSVFMIVPPV
jgi:hypothetical protein